MLGSRNFFRRAPGPTAGEQSGQRLFFVFLVLDFQRASTGFITEKTILSKDPGGGGGPTFSRGATFSTAVQIPIYIETHIT